MSESEHQEWLTAAVTLGLAVFAGIWWMIRRLFSAVTRAELEERVRAMHVENVSRLEGIRGDVRSVHERIDDLYRDLMGARKP